MPFTYIGQPGDGDDIGHNSLPRSTLNILYNIVDLYVVGSRSEEVPTRSWRPRHRAVRL